MMLVKCFGEKTLGIRMRLKDMTEVTYAMRFQLTNDRSVETLWLTEII